MIRLCAVEDTRIQRNAAGTLLNLTHAGEFLPIYFILFYFNNTISQYFFFNIKIAENRTPLVQAGVIVSFVKLLKSRDTEVQYYSAAALSNLAFDGLFYFYFILFFEIRIKI